jgi:hypothetical protein
MTEALQTLPLPDDPLLAAWASVLNDAGYWSEMWDANWRWAFMTDELRISLGETGASTAVPIGSHFFSAESARFRAATLGSALALREFRRAASWTWAATSSRRRPVVATSFAASWILSWPTW